MERDGKQKQKQKRKRKRSSDDESRESESHCDSDSHSHSDSNRGSRDRDERKRHKKKHKQSKSKSKSKSSFKSSKSSKASSKSQGEPKSSPPTKRVDKSTLCPMGKPRDCPPDSAVDPEKDYFAYHKEFSIYLFREEGTCFNDVDTDEAHAAFSRFAAAYNTGALEEPYYTRNFPSGVVEESKTTKHSWNFQTTQSERRSLDDLQKGVRLQTEYSRNNSKINNNKINNNKINNSKINNSKINNSGVCQVINGMEAPAPRATAVPLGAPPKDRSFRPTPEERLEQRRADRRLREDVRVAHDELTGGRKDGRERLFEKKREHSARIHGASKDREGAVAGMELSDADLYGGGGGGGASGGGGGGSRGDDSFRAALTRRKDHQERANERRNNRIEELRAKERERQTNMLKKLGLEHLQGKADGTITTKLTIAPRNDPP